MLEPMVLIETSWNVKMVSISTFFTFTRINRNIVECKDKKSHINYAGFICINRNIVECKDPEQLTILSSFPY